MGKLDFSPPKMLALSSMYVCMYLCMYVSIYLFSHTKWFQCLPLGFDNQVYSFYTNGINLSPTEMHVVYLQSILYLRSF